MLVSVVTPSHNCSAFISETIQSVLNQSFLGWELIVVDDCSTDKSVELIQFFVNLDSRIKLIQLTNNSGAAVARNTAISAAKGRYIAFLDSDDLWLPDKLEKQLVFMQKSNYPFSYTAYDKIDQYGKRFGHVGVPDMVSYTDLLMIPSIGCLTAMYDTEYFGKVFMPMIRKRQDLGLWLCLLKKTDYAYGLNENLALYRVRKDSISANKVDAARFTWRLYRKVEGLNLIKSGYYFTFYAISGLFRHKFPFLARMLGFLK